MAGKTPDFSVEPGPAGDLKILQKAFVVADIPNPYKIKIQAIRDQLNTLTAKLPVEITLAGSSGVGPIAEGTDIGLIRDEVERVAKAAASFRMEFAGIACFPNTGVFFIAPKDRRPFDSLHALLTVSKIPFTRSPFPYTPHCTLRVGPELGQSESQHIYAIQVPRGEVLLDSISVYAIESTTLAVSLLHRTSLRG
jgi:2'-5' RNA ligase